MNELKNRGMHILSETLQAAASITKYHILDSEFESQLRGRFLSIQEKLISPEWIEGKPYTEKIDAFLEKIPPILKEAKEKRYYYTSTYALKAVFYGLEEGYRPLQGEEQYMEAKVLFRRQLCVEQFLFLLDEAEKLDYWLTEQQKIVDRIDILEKNIEWEQEKQNMILALNPTIMEDICYVTDPSLLREREREYLVAQMNELDHRTEMDDLVDQLRTTKSSVQTYNDTFKSEQKKLLQLLGGE